MFKSSSDGGASASANEGAHDIAGTSPSWRCGGFATRCDAMRRARWDAAASSTVRARASRGENPDEEFLSRAARGRGGGAGAARRSNARDFVAANARGATRDIRAAWVWTRRATSARARARETRRCEGEEMKRTRASVTDGLRALARDAGSTRARFRGYCGTRRAPRARARRTTSCGARRR